MHRLMFAFVALAGVFLANCAQAPEQRAPLVLAAASLQESLSEAADAWAALGHPRPTLSFAASSALARQAIDGGPADIFISADEDWMDAVERAGRLAPETRRSFLGNSLVLVAPADSGAAVDLRRPATLLRALGDGRIAMADPEAVPAGRYGKAALVSLGLWQTAATRLARGENVRSALALVERGEAPLGIVYATDARASDAVRVLARFPPEAHPPIRYPAALLADAPAPDASGFLAFLLSPGGRAIFARHGFETEGLR